MKNRYLLKMQTLTWALMVLCMPAMAWAQQQQPIGRVVQNIINLVGGWIITLGFGALGLYALVLGFQWARGDDSAARNWWRPVMGAVLLASGTWFYQQLTTTFGISGQ